MLFLQHAADGSAQATPPRVPVSDEAAAYLEVALLSADNATRLRELDALLAANHDLAAWALRTAEIRLNRTVNRIDEAAQWLSANLVTELASALVDDTPVTPQGCVAWRLSALAKELARYERQFVEFETRLEREKLDAMKELAYGASHEINNPLANIAARAQTLLDGEPDPQRRQKLAAIHRQAMRAHEMIADLMLFARPPKLRKALLDLPLVVRKIVDGLKVLAQENHIAIECVAEEMSIEVVADETQLGVAIHAVVKNAIEAIGDGGHVAVVIGHIEAEQKSWAEILVRDDGPGIADEVRRHMFDPFFSGREAGRGLGFGLSKCWRIVTDHEGQVVVRRPPACGAEISILLPIEHIPSNCKAQTRSR
jgi:signal transduction histidine kinase